jgi:hypothetical protein
MTSPSGKDPHAAVLVAEPVLAHLQRIPGRSRAKRVLSCGRALYPVQLALLAAVDFCAAKVGLTMAAVSLLVFAGLTAFFSFHPLTSTVFSLVIWAALRFGQPAATRMTFVVSGHPDDVRGIDAGADHFQEVVLGVVGVAGVVDRPDEDTGVPKKARHCGQVAAMFMGSLRER